MGLDNETWFLWSRHSQVAIASWDFYSCIYNIRYREIIRSYPFFLAWPRKNQRSQGSHCGGYGLGRYAKISENSLRSNSRDFLTLRSNSRDFLTLRSVDRLTPPPLGRNNWKLKIENWKFIKAGLHRVFNSPLSWVNASRGAACCASIPTRQDKTINNTISPLVFIDCYLVVLNVVLRRSSAAPLPSQGKFQG